MSITKDAGYYLKQLCASEKREQSYRKECDENDKVYAGDLRYNILYSNTDLMLCALANNDPKPIIRVRYPKQSSANSLERETARIVGEVVERAINYNNDKSGFDIWNFVKDSLLYGRGVCKINYQPTIETKDIPVQVSLEPLQPVETISDQTVTSENHTYKEVRFGYAAKWSKMPWIAFLHIMTAQDLEENFGPEIAPKIPLNFKADLQDKSNIGNAPDCAYVWEFWDKQDKTVIFIADSSPVILKKLDDPLHIPGFFPCPKPLQFIEGKAMKPVPEYRTYRKIAEQLFKNCKRSDNIADGIKAVAIAPAKVAKEVNAMVTGEDNDVVTADNSDIGANSGIANIIQEYPNAGKISVLGVLTDRQQNLLNDIYQITGIADILRGQGSPEESATQTRIKGVFGSLRLKSRQRRLQNFIKDIFKITTDIICEHYTQETLEALTSITLPTLEQKQQAQMQMLALQQQGQPVAEGITDILNKPTWADIMNVLQQDKLRSYSIEVESSATAFDGDEDEKNKRLELFTATMQTLEKAIPLMTSLPAVATVFKNLINYTIGGLPQSRGLKESLEDALNALEQQVKAPKSQSASAPTPEQTLAQAELIKAQAEVERVQLKKLELQLDFQKTQAQIAQGQQSVNIDAQKTNNQKEKDLNDLRLHLAQFEQKNKELQAKLALEVNKQNKGQPPCDGAHPVLGAHPVRAQVLDSDRKCA